MFDTVFSSPIGNLGVQIQNEELTGIKFLGQDTIPVKPVSSLAIETVKQLKAYFKGHLKNFSLPLNFSGSSFQMSVWHYLLSIPYGETRTYGEVAAHLKNNPRAVGNACRTNHIPFIIPCHRVVAKDHLGGYSGATSGALLSIKQRLLQLESTIS